MVAPDKQPRKRPQQARARATFDAIVEATELLLDDHEIESLTVQAIAVRAGVSVGSLYQYFPTKDAIVATVIERDVDRVYDALSGLFQATMDQPLEQVFAIMVRAVLSTYTDRLSFYRRVLPEIGRLERDGVIRSVAERAGELLLEAMRRHPEQVAIPVERYDAAQFILARVTNLLAHAVVIERPELLEDSAFADELTRLSTAYLLGSVRT